LEEKIPRRTIYNILQKYERSGEVGDKPRCSRPKKLSRGELTRLKRLVNHKTGISLRRLAPKFWVSHETIRNQLRDMKFNYFTKQKAPKYIDQQLEEIPIPARRLHPLLSDNDFELIMDDEKYFQLADQSVPTNRGFYSSNKRTNSPHVKFKKTRKFEPKILVWIAISASGISSPFFAKQKQAINQDTYLEECIVKRLMPFIESYHDKEKVLFWPDLATSHYSKIVTQYLDQNGVQFVAKEFNPQNCPQARPIETLWSILKNMVYDQGWEARNIDQLERRIAQKMEEIDVNVVQSMFSGIRKQLKKIAEHGPYEACSLQFPIEETLLFPMKYDTRSLNVAFE
jgi:transposase